MRTNKKTEDDNNNPLADSFQRFEDLTNKLVNVPKDEIDKIDPLVQKRKKPKSAKK